MPRQAAPAPTPEVTPVVTVVGIGNPVMGDDGIGLELLHRLVALSPAASPHPATALIDDSLAHQPSAGDSTHLVWNSSHLANPESMDARTEPAAAAVAYIDGGTCGMELLPLIQDAKNLLLLDALAGPGKPGDVVKLVGDQIPRLLAAKLSAHQVGLLDLLTAARLLGREPERVGVVGVVYESAEMVVQLSDKALGGVAAAVPVAQELIEQWLAEEERNQQ